MSGRTDTERILDAFLAPEADRLSDRVIDAALADIARTPQRRALRVPWRFPPMPTYMRLAAGVAIVAILGVGALSLIGQGPSSGREPTPSPTSSPTAQASPTTPLPTPIPPLTETFESSIHGISVSYPSGWIARSATEPWPEGEIVLQGVAFADVIEDGSTSDTAFLALASRPAGATSFDQWAAEYLAQEGCEPSEPVTVDGADGVVSPTCSMALVSTRNRWYLIWLYRVDDRSRFEEILETVQLRPKDAVDVAPSASP